MKWLLLGILVGLGCLSQAVEPEDARIVAAYSTKTAFTFTTSTTTVPYTCISGDAATAACTRRRLRRTAPIGELVAGAERKSLDSSLDMNLEGVDSDDSRDSRVAVTFWTTLSSTYTVTSTSTNSATTFSISYYCTIPGANFAPACG